MNARSAIAGAVGTVLAGVAVFAVVAASNASEPTVSSAPPAIEAPAPASGLGADYYLRTVKSLLSDFEHTPQPDADYIAGGKSICTQIDNGATWQTFAEQIAEYGMDYDFRRQVVGAAVISFCPEHAAILR